MKRLLFVSLAIIFLWSTSAFGEVKEGSCTLKEGSAFDKDVFTVEVGDRIKGTSKFYIDEFFDKKIIYANIEIKNTASIPFFCQYYVAFFDDEGNLVGCATQGSFGDDGLEPGETTQFGSCLIPLPQGKHEKVSSYKIAFYESDSPIGKIK